MKKAVIILGHGSRQRDADSTVRNVAALVRSSGAVEIVTHAFLQHVKPGLEEALEHCVKEGAGNIVIVPFFLQPGSHVTKDVPALVEKAKGQYPDIEFGITQLAGSHPLMASIVLDLVKTCSN